ncbi:MAG: SRPBCC family protein, partial [Gemmatimonadota bacterium]|nr:SRPBCC family protein [Gemmatimonadota bacterium]
RPLAVGAVGGHGPIRYTVEHYERGQRVRFRFTAPPGFEGTHEFVIEPVDPTHSRLRHVIEMQTSGSAVVRWPVIIRPLHDALIEDLLDKAERGLGAVPRPRQWSRWVKALRWMLARARGSFRPGTSRP